MGKVVGAVAGAFVLGGGVMTALGSWLGAYAEVAALGVVGVGLMVASGPIAGRMRRAASSVAGTTSGVLPGAELPKEA